MIEARPCAFRDLVGDEDEVAFEDKVRKVANACRELRRRKTELFPAIRRMRLPS